MVNASIMGDFIDTASSVLQRSNIRLELVANNVGNMRTPGFKRTDAVSTGTALASQDFANVLEVRSDLASYLSASPDLSQGTLSPSDKTFDLALSSKGYFEVRSGDTSLYTRSGQFSRDSEGMLVDPQGFAVQDTQGGDIMLLEANAEILEDGTILENGLPIAKIAVYAPTSALDMTAINGTYLMASSNTMSALDTPMVRQSALESSNVVLADEMLEMMSAMRSAEMGSRLVRTYDTLIGQAISTFSRGG